MLIIYVKRINDCFSRQNPHFDVNYHGCIPSHMPAMTLMGHVTLTSLANYNTVLPRLCHGFATVCHGSVMVWLRFWTCLGQDLDMARAWLFPGNGHGLNTVLARVAF